MNEKASAIIAGLLFMIFGWSSWIDINGIWVELPLLVNRLPEGWFLPAYFVIIVQVANIGPLIYGLSYRYTKFNKHTIRTAFIYGIITIGLLSMLLLAFLWDRTSVIGGELHSTAMLILTFFLAFVDCTSSVTFIPFMYQYKSHHMTAYFVGEGMSGLIPAALAFVQGSGEYTCKNTSSTVNSTTSWSIQPKATPLQFTVRTFFLTIFGMFVMSMVAFSILKYSQIGKSQRKQSQSYQLEAVKEKEPDEREEPVADEGNKFRSTTEMIEAMDENESRGNIPEFFYLLLIIAVTNGLANGALRSVQSFSLLPYGQIYYSVGVKLAALANPLTCLVAFFAATKRISVITILFIITLVCSAYILAISHYSPNPPYNNTVSAVIMVLIWILLMSLVTYIKVVISAKLLPDGHNSLFWLGVSQQVGSLVGGLLSFLCVNYYPALTPAPACDI